MKRLLLSIVALAFLATSAQAASVTFTFATKSKTFTVSAANAARFAAWAAAAYPTIPNPAYVTPCGTPLPACLPQTIPNPDPVLSAIDGLWAGIKANVLSFEREKAKAQVTEPAAID